MLINIIKVTIVKVTAFGLNFQWNTAGLITVHCHQFYQTWHLGNDEEVLPVLAGTVGWRVVPFGGILSVNAAVVGRASAVVDTIFMVVVAVEKVQHVSNS